MILLASFWPWIADSVAVIDYVETYKWLIVPLTTVYFIAATLWIRNRRKVRGE